MSATAILADPGIVTRIADLRAELSDLDTEIACTQGGEWHLWCLCRRWQVKQTLAELIAQYGEEAR